MYRGGILLCTGRGIEGFVGRVKPSHSRVPRGVACDDLNESHISIFSASLPLKFVREDKLGSPMAREAIGSRRTIGIVKGDISIGRFQRIEVRI